MGRRKKAGHILAIARVMSDKTLQLDGNLKLFYCWSTIVKSITEKRITGVLWGFIIIIVTTRLGETNIPETHKH